MKEKEIDLKLQLHNMLFNVGGEETTEDKIERLDSFLMIHNMSYGDLLVKMSEQNQKKFVNEQ